MPKVVKKEVKAEKVVKATVKKEAPEKKIGGLSVAVYAVDGKEAGSMELPKELFGAKVNKPLLSQALRVYLNNLKGHYSNTKTRGEVTASTRKVRAQKGTGGARHGSIKAPIFVGGGIALGPKFRKAALELPKKMKKAALISSLSAKAHDGSIVGLSGADKLNGKTSELKALINGFPKKSALLVVGEENDKLNRAASNLPSVKVLTAAQLNALNIIQHHTLVLTKEAVAKLEAKFQKEEKKETK